LQGLRVLRVAAFFLAVIFLARKAGMPGNFVSITHLEAVFLASDFGVTGRAGEYLAPVAVGTEAFTVAWLLAQVSSKQELLVSKMILA
jgi:hypothetical protein